MRGIMIGVAAALVGVTIAASAAEDEGYTYTLYVKNRDLTTENVDVSVYVDHKFATRETLRFGDVEEVRAIELDLEPGSHRIRVEALQGTDKIEQEMGVAGEGSADVLIWFDRAVETLPAEVLKPPEEYSTP
jgi:archaellum component FlaG (FlaF/FlaG flagellin family)